MCDHNNIFHAEIFSRFWRGNVFFSLTIVFFWIKNQKSHHYVIKIYLQIFGKFKFQTSKFKNIRMLVAFTCWISRHEKFARTNCARFSKKLTEWIKKGNEKKAEGTNGEYCKTGWMSCDWSTQKCPHFPNITFHQCPTENQQIANKSILEFKISKSFLIKRQEVKLFEPYAFYTIPKDTPSTTFYWSAIIRRIVMFPNFPLIWRRAEKGSKQYFYVWLFWLLNNKI